MKCDYFRRPKIICKVEEPHAAVESRSDDIRVVHAVLDEQTNWATAAAIFLSLCELRLFHYCCLTLRVLASATWNGLESRRKDAGRGSRL